MRYYNCPICNDFCGTSYSTYSHLRTDHRFNEELALSVWWGTMAMGIRTSRPRRARGRDRRESRDGATCRVPATTRAVAAGSSPVVALQWPN